MTNGRQRTEKWRRWPARSQPRAERVVAPALADEPYTDAEGAVVHMTTEPVTTVTEPVELTRVPAADIPFWLQPIPPLDPDEFAKSLAPPPGD